MAPARKEKTCVYFLPHTRTRAAGYLNREWEVCDNRGTKDFFNAVNFSGAHCLLRVLDASFIVLCV